MTMSLVFCSARNGFVEGIAALVCSPIIDLFTSGIRYLLHRYFHTISALIIFFATTTALKCHCDICSAESNFTCESDGFCFTSTSLNRKTKALTHSYRYNSNDVTSNPSCLGSFLSCLHFFIALNVGSEAHDL